MQKNGIWIYIEDINNNIKPNYIQRKALKELRRYRDMGINKALIVSATESFEPTPHCYN